MLTLGSLTGLSYVGNHAYLAYQKDTVRGSLDAAGKVLAHDHMARIAKFRATIPVPNPIPVRTEGQLRSIAQNFVNLNLEDSGLFVTVTAASLSLTNYQVTVVIYANLDPSSTFGMEVPFMSGFFGQAVQEFKSETVWQTTARPLEMVILMETSAAMLRAFKPPPSAGQPPCPRPGGDGYFASALHPDPDCKRSRGEVVTQIVQNDILNRFGRGSPSANITEGISMALVPYSETVNLYNDQYASGGFSYRQRINPNVINFDREPYSPGAVDGTLYDTNGVYPAHPDPDTWAGCVEVKPGRNTDEFMVPAVVADTSGINSRRNPPSPNGKFWDISYREIPNGPGLTDRFLNAWQAPDLLSRVPVSGSSWNTEIGEITKVVAGDKIAMSVVPDIRPPGAQSLVDTNLWRQPLTDPAAPGTVRTLLSIMVRRAYRCLTTIILMSMIGPHRPCMKRSSMAWRAVLNGSYFPR